MGDPDNYWPGEEPWYDVAQSCLNGHLITASSKLSPAGRQAHCSQCGSATIDACQSCQTPIRGDLQSINVISYGLTDPPAFCHGCGAAYPWTTARLEAAKEMARELEGLSPEEGEQLASTLDDLVRATPRSELAATRFRKLLTKVGKPAATAFRSFAIEVVAERIKKCLEP